MIQNSIKVIKDSVGNTYPAILSLPSNYGTSTTKYPLLIFLHGTGEAGTNLASIYGSSTAGGPSYFIEQGQFPAKETFIVVSPQAPSWSTTAPELDFILKDIVAKYRVDISRIYLTGLSAGGEGIVEYVAGVIASGATFTKSFDIAAIVPMSAVMNATQEVNIAQKIVTDNVQVWAFGSPTDTHGANTLGLVNWYIWKNLINKPTYGIVTSYSGGHCCWGQFYNPKFMQSGLSIYDWMLQFSTKASIPPVIVAPPVVTPPPPLVVVKTIKSVTITYSDGTVETKP